MGNQSDVILRVQLQGSSRTDGAKPSFWNFQTMLGFSQQSDRAILAEAPRGPRDLTSVVLMRETVVQCLPCSLRLQIWANHQVTEEEIWRSASWRFIMLVFLPLWVKYIDNRDES